MATAEEALRQMQQQFTTALEGLSRQNAELQAELEQTRQAAASGLAALRQQLRNPQRITSAAVGVDTRLLGNLASSRVRKKLGVTGVLCSRDMLAQRCHDCRS